MVIAPLQMHHILKCWFSTFCFMFSSRSQLEHIHRIRSIRRGRHLKCGTRIAEFIFDCIHFLFKDTLMKGTSTPYLSRPDQDWFFSVQFLTSKPISIARRKTWRT